MTVLSGVSRGLGALLPRFVEGRRCWGEMERGEKEGGTPGIHFVVFISERSCGAVERVYSGSGVWKMAIVMEYCD